MKFVAFASLLACSLFASCIGTDVVDDFVEPELRIGPTPDTLAIGESLQLPATYFNSVGASEDVALLWESADPDIISITSDGLATGLQVGSTDLTASFTNGMHTVLDTVGLTVASTSTTEPIISERSGTIQTTSSYRLEGAFTITENSGELTIDVDDDYVASDALPGLYLYLTNNPNTTNGALEIGPVQVFEGAHSYTVENVGIEEYGYLLYFCKPFSVKVGDGEFAE